MNNKNKIQIALLAVGSYIAYKTYTKFNGVIADAVTPAANLWVSLTTDAPVKTNSAYIFIKSRDVDTNNKLKNYAIDAFTTANADNALIIKQLLDPYGRIKPEHTHFIDADYPATLERIGN